MCSYIVIHTPTLTLESWLIELKLRAWCCLLTVFVKLLIIFITLWHSGVAVSIVASQQEDPRVELECLPVLSLGVRLPPTTHRCAFRPVALLSPSSHPRLFAADGCFHSRFLPVQQEFFLLAVASCLVIVGCLPQVGMWMVVFVFIKDTLQLPLTLNLIVEITDILPPWLKNPCSK